MVRAACHCTALRFEITELPEWVLDCNCTICRRYGAIWAYPEANKVKCVRGADSTETYIWGDRGLAFHRCKECGCVTHMAALDSDPPRIYGINARMIPTLDPASVRLRQRDNGHTGFFWTRSAEPPEPSHHPKMALPGPDDWR
jgi:hypothetical protein